MELKSSSNVKFVHVTLIRSLKSAKIREFERGDQRRVVFPHDGI